MAATAENLRELHALHLRAKAIRDRLASGPKTLAARRAALAQRQAELAAAREAIKRARAEIKNKEVQAVAMHARSDDLRAKLNTIKKQAEYDALRNEIAHNNLAVSKLEEEILDLMQKLETDEAALGSLEHDVAQLTQDVARLESTIQSQSAEAQAQLAELEAAITAAEAIIPDDLRDRYRRVLKQRGADAMAPVEDGACHGCFVAITAQAQNDLINAETLVFCQICGRILYSAEQPQNVRTRVTT
ncbi:MAG: hypothetical protein KatS3mg108_3627 [Isosphaeraceae bacterium]|nr:MAG: hypothetical protein KatS3mg108_3627 [Isosphaeraceae bacterium]